jgi:hypothetical protein
MKKHIPTLTILFYPEHKTYGYEYDDIHGSLQTEYGYPSVSDALGDAFKRLRTFLVLEDVETR